jgi:hypothetical protein
MDLPRIYFGAADRTASNQGMAYQPGHWNNNGMNVPGLFVNGGGGR